MEFDANARNCYLEDLFPKYDSNLHSVPSVDTRRHHNVLMPVKAMWRTYDAHSKSPEISADPAGIGGYKLML